MMPFLASWFFAESQADADRVFVGMTKQEVVKILGQPDDADGGHAWRYEVRGYSDHMELWFRKGKVSEISFP